MTVIVVTLLVTTWASLRKNKKDAQRRQEHGAGEPGADSSGRHIGAPGDPDADTTDAPAGPREVPVSRPESRTD